MKIRFDKDELIEAITPALGAVSEKNTISAIEGILFSSLGDDKCILSAYDLEKGYRTEIKAEVIEEGTSIINAQKLYRMIKMMPERNVIIEVDEKYRAKIYSGASRFALSALPGADFPNLPELNGEGKVRMKQCTLKRIIGQVQHALALGNQRPTLTGAFFKLDKEKFTVVTCDGNRLAKRERESGYDIQEGEEYSFIIPGKTLGELYKILKADGEEQVEISFGRKHVIFRMGGSIFFSRLIEGEYIDYKRVIPKSNNIKARIDRRDLISSLERVSLVTDDKSVGQLMGFVRCCFEGNELKVSSTSSVSSVNDEIEIEKEGADIVIGFNCRYFLDALRAISDDTIELSLGTPLTSIVIKRDSKVEKDGEEDQKENEGDYLYMICPVKMKD